MQKSKMFKKSYFTLGRSKTLVNSEDGTACNNGLRLNGVYYSIVTKISILNVDMALRPAFDYNGISQSS